MTTVRLGSTPGIQQLRFDEDDGDGNPGPDEIVVKIHASSLNQHDYNVVLGRLPSEPGRILLADASGVVEAVGENVEDLAPGDQVISCFFPYWQDGQPTIPDFSTTPGDGLDGFARSRVVCPSTWFTRAPAHLSFLQAATLPTAGLTAWRALVVEGQIKAGDSVLLLGTGGVAIFALQLAKAVGAHVIVTSSSDEKLARAAALGANQTINYREHPEWEREVLTRTDGRGVDHVMEIGGPGTLPQSIAACRVGGHISLIGVLTGVAGAVPTAHLMARQQRLQGIIVGSRQQQIDMVRGLEAISLVPVIDRTFQLQHLGEAFTALAEATHFGKIAIQIA